MKEEININELARVEIPPKIIVQVKEIGKIIDKALDGIDNIECNEENKKEVKDRRSEINKFIKALEDKRKEIKNQVMSSYVEFEEIYDKECREKLENASELLGEKINDIETAQKLERETMLREFFEEYQKNYHLENIITFESIGLNITLSASEKSLKDQIITFCEKIYKDLQVINNEENKEELMYEYLNNGYDYQQAKLTLFEKKKRLEEIKNQQEKAEEIIKKEEEIANEIKEIIPEEILEVTFTVRATKSQLRELKQWLEIGGIEYE